MIRGATYCLKGHFVGAEEPPPRDWDQIQEAALREFDEDEGYKLPAFCTECGSANISTCNQCQRKIDFNNGRRPQYCGGCGSPFPWTADALSAAREYADELDQFSSEDKTALKATIADLTTDTARTPLAATHFKKFMGMAGPAAAEIFKKIIATVLTEGAKKLIGL
jgi:hypothetical protein